MKIVNRKKFVRSVFFILLGILMFSLLVSTTTLSHTEMHYKTIYASKGDTLWSIAKEESKHNEYYKDKDVRDVVEHIKAVNQLQQSRLGIGDALKIPTM